ncbi:MAG: hypothetical protein WEG36_06500 [Gemmatimonadota bacterium]
MQTTIVPTVLAFLLAVIPAHTVVAQQQALTEEAVVALTGEWSGTIVVGPTLSQDVRWRFERTSSGEFLGFMGPVAMGAPTIPMQNITSEGVTLRFAVNSQNAEFVGSISDGAATGTWRQGQWGSAILTRPDPDTGRDALPSGGAYSMVLGQWAGRPGESPDGPPNTYFRFELGDAGELIGFAGDTPGTITTPLANVVLMGSELSFQAPA